MKAIEIVKILKSADYRETLKAIIMYEEDCTEDEAEAIFDRYMEDDSSTRLWDLKEHI